MNPFVGPKPFGMDDTLYGRDAEVSELRYFVGAKRIVLLHAASGAGKSSLLQARNGLLARLRESGRFDVWGPARINGAPGNLPVANRFAWSAITEFEKGRTDARPPETFAGTTLAEYVKQRSTAASPLLVFDQFEEVLRVDPANTLAKQQFFDQLGELLYDPGIWAIFVLREDYLAALLPYARQVPTHLQHRFRIDFLNREIQALEAVTKPLASAGRVFAPDVAENMLKDLATVKSQSGDVVGDVVEPLQIQVVCTNLWERIKDNDPALPILAANIGNVGDALGAYYERGVKRADVGLERQIRTFFDQVLITDGIRNLVRSEPSVTEGLANEEIEKLVDVYLIRKELRAGAYWLELSHDRLLQPVRASNERWFADSRNIQKFQRYATEWRHDDRPESLLLLGKDLDEAKAWAKSHPELLSKPEPDEGFPDGVDRAFLAASEAKEKAIDHEARQATKLRWGLRVAVVAAVLAVGFGVYSLRLANRASRAEDAATQSAQAALQSAQRAKVALARSAVQEGERLAAAGEESEALAHFARALRADPSSLAAVSWISSIAMNRDGWLASLLEHDDIAYPVAFTPDGTKAVTSCCDAHRILQVWDVDRRTKIGPAIDHGDDVQMTGFVGDESRLMTTDAQGARVWDIATGKPVGGVMAIAVGSGSGESKLQASALSRDGRRAVLADAEGAMRVWNVETAEPIGPIMRSSAVMTVDFSADSRRLLSAHADGTVRTWAVETGAQIAPIFRVAGVQGAGYSADGRRILTLSNGSSTMWDAATGRRIRVPSAIKGNLFYSDDGRKAVSNYEGHAQLWDVSTGAALGHPLPEEVDAAVFSGDGGRVLLRTAGNSTVTRVFDTETGAPVGPPLANGTLVATASMSPNGRRAMTSTFETAVRLWESYALNEMWLLKHEFDLSGAYFSPDGRRILLSTSGPEELWDANSGQKIASCQQGRDPWLAAAVFAPDGLRSVLLSEDRSTAQVWDTDGCRPLGSRVSAPGITTAALTPDGRRLFIASEVETKVWDVTTSTNVGTLPSGGSVVVSRDGRRLLTGIETLNLRIWDATALTEVGKPIDFHDRVTREAVKIDTAVLSPDAASVLFTAFDVAEVRDILTGVTRARVTHKNGVRFAEFSPDGRRFLTVSVRTVQVWDAASGNALGAPLVHQAEVTDATFSPDGIRVLTATTANVAEVWDAESGMPITPTLQHDDGLVTAIFSPDGHSVLTVDLDKTVRIWPVLVACCANQDEADRLANLAEAMSGSEVSETGALRPVDGFKRLQSAVRTPPADAKPAPRLSLDWLVGRFTSNAN